jgi:hypothetical protein
MVFFVILETSVPDKTPYKQGYNFYSKKYPTHHRQTFQKMMWHMATCQNQLLHYSFEQYIAKNWVYRCDSLTTDIWGSYHLFGI